MSLGDNCRTGCPTKDHRSFGECARQSVQFAPWYSADSRKGKDWHGELKEYRDARAQGIQPATTRRADIRAAVKVSQAADKPFNAGTGGFD